jgi:hypothetical protein
MASGRSTASNARAGVDVGPCLHPMSLFTGERDDAAEWGSRRGWAQPEQRQVARRPGSTTGCSSSTRIAAPAVPWRGPRAAPRGRRCLREAALPSHRRLDPEAPPIAWPWRRACRTPWDELSGKYPRWCWPRPGRRRRIDGRRNARFLRVIEGRRAEGPGAAPRAARGDRHASDGSALHWAAFTLTGDWRRSHHTRDLVNGAGFWARPSRGSSSSSDFSLHWRTRQRGERGSPA